MKIVKLLMWNIDVKNAVSPDRKLLGCDRMAEVMATFKVMPTGTDVDLDKLEADVQTAIKADRINREPIAFGLVALKVIKIIPDAGGVIDEIENKLKNIDGVGSVEVTDLTRTL